MKKQALTLVITLLAIFLVACNSDSSKDPDNKDIKKQVHEYSVGSFDETVNASITSHELIVQEDGVTKETYDLPADAFFVSIAPFETKTHECAVHSLTGCQGELVEEVFDVQITDEKGKNKVILVDEKAGKVVRTITPSTGITKQQAADIVKKEDKVQKILHTSLGMEKENLFWEVTYLGEDDSLNYVYLNFKDGKWQKRIMHL